MLGRGGGPQKCVRWEGVQCSVGVNCMYVCPERGHTSIVGHPKCGRGVRVGNGALYD